MAIEPSLVALTSLPIATDDSPEAIPLTNTKASLADAFTTEPIAIAPSDPFEIVAPSPMAIVDVARA